MTDIAIATAEALRELTGYVRPDAQRRWLQEALQGGAELSDFAVSEAEAA